MTRLPAASMRNRWRRSRWRVVRAPWGLLPAPMGFGRIELAWVDAPEDVMEGRSMRKPIAVIAVGIALVAGAAFGKSPQRNHFKVRLDGNQEVLPVSTTGNGALEIHI